MKKKVKLFYGIFALFVLVLAVFDLNTLLHVNGNVTLDTEQENDFNIKINDYTLVRNQLNIDYSVFNAAPESKEIEINYQLLDINGNYLAQEASEVVFNPSSNNNYKLKIPNNQSDKISLIRLSAYNGYLTAETEKSLNIQPKLTGFAISENPGSVSNLMVAILLIGAILFISRKIYKISTTSRKLSKVQDNIIPIKIN